MNNKKFALVPKLRFPEFKDYEMWERKTLDSLTIKISDGIHTTPVYSEDGKCYFINGNNFFHGKIWIDEKTKRVSEEEYNKHKRDLSSSTILISINGTIGNVAIYNDEKVILGKSACYINVDKTKAEKIFIIYFIQTNEVESYFHSELTGSTIKNLSLKSIKETVIKIPSLPEQQKIADCLSSLDDLITAEDKKLAALKEHKKGLMQKLFPAEGKTVPELRFSEFRDEWSKLSLIDVTDKKIKWGFTGGPFGSNLKSSDYTSNGIRVIQLQNIGDGVFIDEYKIFTSEDKADELLSCNIYPDEIIMSKMGDPVGRACIIPNTHKRYLMCSDGIRLVVDGKKYNNYFIFLLINSDSFRSIIEKNATGSTRKRIGLDILKNLKLTIPKEKAEQQKIADCLSSLDNLITAQTEKIETLKLHKKGLMQGLFPGIEQ